ncbi:osmotically inducible protein OsmC [Paraburkholderia ginsengiterrae]|uniref:Osmotically inducible protein OsmC n=1 Tax=Paraburkholderia ginsengiterrae TaxID=1462993 RepID=A0A1A9N492_9BURK|nr:OsmC family protein [Paraburkholderia ginsengiterrae]OAJ55987.1 osmotically inducible protein OsmC [Paraburkholderia ginsengiterrae]OAJ58555.1 osmotically inducible protein OsmC [Paraburkholderia ginsengiterrae]
MSEHKTALRWQRAAHPEKADSYSRNHSAVLGGNQHVTVSASVDYMGDANAADPEQLLVASLASCHMLFFLAIADAQGYLIESYEDHPIGRLGKDANGGMAVNTIDLCPEVRFGGDKKPDAVALERLHNAAHKRCFIANSITATVTVHRMDLNLISA